MKKSLGFCLSLLLIFLLSACKAEDSNLGAITDSSSKNISLLQKFNRVESQLNNISDINKKESEIDRLIDQIGVGNFPLIEGNDIIFIYRADSTDKNIAFVSDLSNWRRIKMKRLSDTNLYYLQLKAPQGARFDYEFVVDGEFKNDPLNNSQVANDALGFSSQVIMDKYSGRKYWREDNRVRKGSLYTERIKDIEVSIYLPADYEKSSVKRYPVLYFIGGDKYLENANITDTLDNMIADNKIDRVMGVFINSKDLSSEERKSSRLIKNVINYIDEEYSTIDDPNKRILIGYDIFAELALHSILEDDGVVASYLGQSPLLSKESIELLTENQQRDMSFYVHWGEFANKHNSPNDFELIKKLKDLDYRYKAEINLDGNSWGNWRENIAQGLEYILSDGPSSDGVDRLEIRENFDDVYLNDFKIENNKSVIAEQWDGIYQLTFKDTSFVKLSNYKFGKFHLEAELKMLSDYPLGLLFSGNKSYTLMINSKKKSISVFGNSGEEVYSIGIGEILPVNSIQLIAKDDKLEIYLNGQKIGTSPFYTKTAKYVSILGVKGTKVKFDNLSIKEEF